MKLELQNERQKVTRVRDVRGHVILGAGVEIALAAGHGRSYALILLPELPPSLVVLFRRNLAGENFPAPLVDQQPEGQERDFFERRLKEQSHVLGWVGCGLEQSDPDQVFRRHR